MRIVLLAALFCFGATHLFAQHAFDLEAPDGKRTGPFAFKDGQKIKFGGVTYTLRVRKASNVPLTRKLQTIRIDELQFRDTDLRDVLEFLRVVSRQQDPEGIGVNIVLMPGTVKAPEGEGAVVTQAPFPKLTMSLKNVTLGEAIKLIKASTRYQFVVQDSAVSVYPPKR